MNTFKSYQSVGITTNTVVFTGPANTQSTVMGMSIANTHIGVVYVDVKLNSAYIIKSAPIGVGSSLIVVGAEQKIVVGAGDIVSVVSTGNVDCITSTLEIN